MEKIAGDAMLIEKEHFKVEFIVSDYLINGKFTLFKGEKIISELNNERRFLELTQCQVKNKEGKLLEQPTKLYINKSFIELFKIIPADS